MPATFLALILLLPATLFAQISVPEGDNVETIAISAQAANRWQQGAYEVWLLRGDCRLVQGDDVAVCQEAVFWIEHAAAGSHRRTKVIAYLEGNVGVRLIRDRQPVEIHDQKWFGHFYTIYDVQIRAGRVAGKPDVLPGIYQRGMNEQNPEFADALRQTHVEPVQYVAAANELPPPGKPPPGAGPLPPGTPPVAQGMRRIRVFARGDVPMHGQWQQDPQTNEAKAVIDQGVTMVIEGLTTRKGNVPGLGGGPLTIDLSTDRLVIWTVASRQPDINAPLSQDENQPLEIYMEGNVVFRQGDRIIYADRMYYDVRHHLGTVLGADMLTPAPGYEGKVRVHADVLQEIDEDRFRAEDVFVTSSRLGIPRYRLQMSEAQFDDRQTPRVDWLGNPVMDPKTGQQAIDHQELVAAQNNFLYIESVPIFYWPTFATDLNDPSFFLRRVQAAENGVFGPALYTDWAAYQLLGIKNRPVGTDWTVSFDYLSCAALRRARSSCISATISSAFPARFRGRSTSGAFSTAEPMTWAMAVPTSCPNPTSTIVIASWSNIARTWAGALPSRPRWARSAIATSCWNISSRTGTSKRIPPPTWN